VASETLVHDVICVRDSVLRAAHVPGKNVCCLEVTSQGYWVVQGSCFEDCKKNVDVYVVLLQVGVTADGNLDAESIRSMTKEAIDFCEGRDDRLPPTFAIVLGETSGRRDREALAKLTVCLFNYGVLDVMLQSNYPGELVFQENIKSNIVGVLDGPMDSRQQQQQDRQSHQDQQQQQQQQQEQKQQKQQKEQQVLKLQEDNERLHASIGHLRESIEEGLAERERQRAIYEENVRQELRLTWQIEDLLELYRIDGLAPF